MDRWKARLQDWRLPLLVGFFTGALTLFFGAAFAATVGQQIPASFAEVWTQWDSVHYLTLATRGYAAAADSKFLICFFPLYPALLHLGAFLFRDAFVAGLVVSNVAFAAGLVFLLKLVELDFSRRTAELAVLFCAVFPAAYFFHLVYTESLFFALSVGAFYFARTGRWWLAGTAALCAGLTRLPGAMLVPALLWEYLEQRRFQWREIRGDVLAVFLPVAAAASYLVLNAAILGDPFAFLVAQKGTFHREFSSPWLGFFYDFRHLFAGDANQRYMMAWPQISTFILTLGVLIWSARRLRASYTVFALLLWVLTFCYSFWMSVPRLAMMLFPIYICLARLTEDRPALRANLFFASALLYTFGTLQFALGHWAH